MRDPDAIRDPDAVSAPSPVRGLAGRGRAADTPASGRASVLLGAVRVFGSRLLGVLVVVWAAITAAFFALRAIPGDPVDVMLGPLATVSDRMKDEIRADLGLADPLWQQYLATLRGYLQGDLGQSYQLRQPVTQALGQALGPTAQLAAFALGCALVLVLLGVLFGRRGTGAAVVGTAEVIAVVLPTFWVGFLLLTLFAFTLGWFPASGAGSFGALVLPGLAMAIPIAGVLGQSVRAELRDADARPFALSAKARGVSDARFALTHGIRHASVPAATLLGTIAGGLLGGAILTETVFSRPGLGQLTLTAISNRDIPLILGLVAVSAVTFGVLSALADLCVWLADPRGRVQRPVRPAAAGRRANLRSERANLRSKNMSPHLGRANQEAPL